MDVNKAQGIKIVNDSPNRKSSNRSDNQGSTTDLEEYEHLPSWSANEAVSLAGALAGSLSEESQKILEIFAAEMKPLRSEIDRLTARESHYREMAVNHAFLPVLNRREFLRELNHVIEYRTRSPLPVGVFIFHILDAVNFRRHHGRHAADVLLCHFAENLAAALQPNDILGSIGGEDFAVIADTLGSTTLSSRLNEIKEQLCRISFNWLGQEFPLGVFSGWTELREEWSAERALGEADKNLCENFCDNVRG